MNPLEHLKALSLQISKRITYCNNDIAIMEADLKKLYDEKQALLDEQDEYDAFVAKNEVTVDADSGRDPGVLIEPPPEDLRQPSPITDVPL